MGACCQSPTNACCDVPGKQSRASLSIALVGNPNCGKTTLFNALTGSRQKVGNWPGVTVERKSGYFNEAGVVVETVDLPGIYSLIQASETAAVDERIACDFILQRHVDVVVNIVDASNLERHLYLTIQLLEMGVPVLLALNMMDVAHSRCLRIDSKQLSRALGCPVVALEARSGGGVAQLKKAIVSYAGAQTKPLSLPYPAEIEQILASLTRNSDEEKSVSRFMAIRLLEGDAHARQQVAASAQQRIQTLQAASQQAMHEDTDIVIADTRYCFIQQLLAHCLTRGAAPTTWTSRIDSIVLNRVLGIPIFLGVMYLLFVFAINIGGAFQDFFDLSSQTIFVDGFAEILARLGAPTWLIALLANGVGKGINTTLTFIPVIGAMFLFLALLEDSGYMARAAFVIDRLMRALGLPGKAFVPMIVGFGCNVPAVMAARTLENKRDRILTIMMSPFMSCTARLAIYAVFAAAFFTRGAQNIVFSLYLIGIAMAVLTGFLLRKTWLKGEPAPLVMELPPYHLPRFNTLLLHAWQRLKGFVFRAGKLIVPICVLLGVLNTLNIDGSLNTGEGDTQSLLSLVGQWVTPIFAPMGIHADNWPATVGLVTGVLAKEVVVGTLNTLYTQMGHLAAATGTGAFHFWANLQEAVLSIPANFAQLGQALVNPVLAKAPIDPVNQGVYGLMAQRFDGKTGAFAYLLFVLLYFPCVSTMAAMLRELHRGWAVFSALWTTGLAYGAAVVFYQAMTWPRHPWESFFWITAIAVAFWSTITAIRWYAHEADKALSLSESLPAGESV